ncbi:MAG: hypothetical protein U0I51_07425, partial [Muricomes sp.]|nr:hypothetical protein [Muricomes sp.]
MNEGTDAAGTGHRDGWGRKQTVSWSKGKKKETRGNLGTSREALMASRAGPRDFCDSESQK